MSALRKVCIRHATIWLKCCARLTRSVACHSSPCADGGSKSQRWPADAIASGCRLLAVRRAVRPDSLSTSRWCRPGLVVPTPENKVPLVPTADGLREFVYRISCRREPLVPRDDRSSHPHPTACRRPRVEIMSGCTHRSHPMMAGPGSVRDCQMSVGQTIRRALASRSSLRPCDLSATESGWWNESGFQTRSIGAVVIVVISERDATIGGFVANIGT